MIHAAPFVRTPHHISKPETRYLFQIQGTEKQPTPICNQSVYCIPQYFCIPNWSIKYETYPFPIQWQTIHNRTSPFQIGYSVPGGKYRKIDTQSNDNQKCLLCQPHQQYTHPATFVTLFFKLRCPTSIPSISIPFSV